MPIGGADRTFRAFRRPAAVASGDPGILALICR